jgi:TonB family protein
LQAYYVQVYSCVIVYTDKFSIFIGMKILYTCLTAAFIVVTVHFASAQTQTSYYNKGGVKLLSADGAHFFEQTDYNASGGGTRTRFLKANNVKVSLHNYSSFEGEEDNNEILNGDYYLWYNNGKLSEKGSYENNKLHGKFSTWFENGQLSYEKFYFKGELKDTLKGYYEDGALRRIEVYKEGEMVDGKVFSKAGVGLPYFPAFVMPEFPGGENAMIAYISKNLKYPEEALRYGISGLVLITFIVEKDGSIKTLEVIKSVYDVLDNEAIRIIRSMPRWKPGLNEGNLVPVSFTLPVRFAFSD